MNTLMFWPGSKRPHKKTPFRTKSKIKSLLMESPSNKGEPPINSIDEIRRQAVNIASSGRSPSTLTLKNKPDKDQKPK